MARSRTPDDKVGYGNPPRHTRFKPGQSGNPGGRRKRNPAPSPPAGVSEDDAMLLRILDEEVCLAVDGRKRRMTRREASLRALIDQAMAGDMRADVTPNFPPAGIRAERLFCASARLKQWAA